MAPSSPLGPADDEHPRIGYRPANPVECVDGHVESLERLDATDEEDRRLVGQTETLPGGGPVTWTEAVVVDTRWGCAKPSRVGAVVEHQVLRLERGGGDDAIGQSDDLVLGGDAEEALWRLVCSPGRILDPPESVERVGQRDVELALHEDAGPAGKPVVRVDQVVAHPGGLRPGDRGRSELAHQPGLVGGGQRLGGTGVDVDHPISGVGLDDRGHRRIGAPGEHVHPDASPDHGCRKLVDVDVHPAGVAATGDEQRRGVHRHVGDAFDHRVARSS